MIANIVGEVPAFRQQTWLRELAEDLLPIEGYITARELTDTEEECEAMTQLLDILIETGHAMSILTIVGDTKEWVYGRNNAKFL